MPGTTDPTARLELSYVVVALRVKYWKFSTSSFSSLGHVLYMYLKNFSYSILYIATGVLQKSAFS